MIFATYGLSGLLLAVTAQLFYMGLLDATTQTAMWSIVFFFASAAASAAYLTVGESFPLEIRALTIALFYAFGTLLGGVGGPWLFGVLIASESPTRYRAGLRAGRGRDDRGRPGRPEARRQGRAPAAGGGGAAAVAAPLISPPQRGWGGIVKGYRELPVVSTEARRAERRDLSLNDKSLIAERRSLRSALRAPVETTEILICDSSACASARRCGPTGPTSCPT